MGGLLLIYPLTLLSIFSCIYNIYVLKDWDVSEDPELLKVLNMAKMLGRAQAPKVQTFTRNPLFDLLPTAIRKLTNPKAPVKHCMASLQRNLAGFGPNGGKYELTINTHS